MLTHDAIIDYILTKECFPSVSRTQLKTDIFSNYKPSTDTGWRLSEFGLTLFLKYFQACPINVIKPVTAKQLIQMARIFPSPFYTTLGSNDIIVFDNVLYLIIERYTLDVVLNKK